MIKPNLRKLRHNLFARKRRKLIGSLVTIIVIVFVFYAFFAMPPANFPVGAIIPIDKGMSVSDISVYLQRKEIIKSPALFKMLFRMGESGKVIAGDYLFKNRFSLFEIAWRLRTGNFDLDRTKVTIQEGTDNKEIAAIMKKKIPTFDTEKFLEAAKDKEGMLFPDTYFFKKNETENGVITEMYNNFTRHIEPLQADIKASKKSLNEILTMASLLEKEARTTESRKIIAGILWSRIEKGMKLQVDAVFPYIMNKYSLQLTLSDLAHRSPYNTYRYKGLPPGPITNPGLNAIEAALNPTKTEYLYYLSDRAGTMYYAKTFKEHMQNRDMYMVN